MKRMATLNIGFICKIHFVLLLLQVFCQLCYVDTVQWRSDTLFGLTGSASLEVNLESSTSATVIQGGDTVHLNISVSYQRDEALNIESSFEDYCQYVEHLKNNDFFSGGDTVQNCSNITSTWESNYTCNSTDGLNCISNLTANSSVFNPNISSANQTENITYSLIVKKILHNITSLYCVNVTTPIVKIQPVIQPLSYFNLSRQNLEIEIELPSELNIESIGNLILTHQFDNITLNCTDFAMNSSYVLHSTKPKIKFHVQFANISWNGSVAILAIVSERVVPREVLNITGNVSFVGISKSLWIGSYIVPGLWFKDMIMASTTFAQTPGNLLTDEEEVTIMTSFVIPSLTTTIQVFVNLPVFASSLPLQIITARLFSMGGNIQSSNLRVGSNIGSNIVLSEVVSLNPTASTLVKFVFGTTSNPPGFINSSVTLQVIGKVDSDRRNEGYIPTSLGNITSWMIYSTAFGDETITSPQWIELELGQPQIKYEMSLIKQGIYVEGGDNIECLFQFYNPKFATESADVNFDVSFATQDSMKLMNSTVTVCNITLDTSSRSYCQNTSTWPLLTITNTSSSFSIQLANMTSGYGVYGKVVSTVLLSVSASEVLRNKANIQYYRQGWSPAVEDQESLTAVVKLIQLSSATIETSSVPSTTSVDLTIGEEVTFVITGTIPITTNENFAVIVENADNSVSFEGGTFLHVGENIVGRGLSTGTGLNITSGYISEAATTFSSPVMLGQFDTVRNTGNSSSSTAATFTLQGKFFIKDISSNQNNKEFKVLTNVYHSPDRKYKSEKSFKIVEPEIEAAVVVSPDKGVEQNIDVSYTATIKHSSSSKSDAYNILVQLAVPHPQLTSVSGLTSKTGRLRIVSGNLAPRPFLSSQYINSSVIVYENDVFQFNSDPIEIKYKARTSRTLPSSEFINSSFVMFYTNLPNTLNQSLARDYSIGPRPEPTFLTFRPDPYLTFAFKSENEGLFDAGDVLNYTIALKNVGVGNIQPDAYSVNVTVRLSKTLFKDSSIVCNQGAITSLSTASLYTLTIKRSPCVFDEELTCNLTTTLNTVVPSQVVALRSTLTYHCLPTGLQHHYEQYFSEGLTQVVVKPLTIDLYASGSTSQLMTGDSVEFNMKITLPEVRTTLRIEYTLPTISNDARGKRSLRKKRAALIDVLKPVLSNTSYTSGSSLVVSTMTTSELTHIYVIDFTSIANLPDNVPTAGDVLVVKAKFLVANRPIILSGRNFDILTTVFYTGGSRAQTAKISIVGPLLKPLLQLVKSFQVLDPHLDSPSGIFYVNISHSPGSLYDAYDVNVSDTIEGMNVIPDKQYTGTKISALTDNKYMIHCNIPVIVVDKTIRFYYKTQFKVDIQTPKYIQTPASITWRSPQLNSPAYGPQINSDACVARNDTIKERNEPLYGFLALGAFLGLVIGFIIIIICVCIFIKCCEKGRLVPYYRVFAGKTTYTALQEEEGHDKPFSTTTNTNTNTSIEQTESVIYIIASDDSNQTDKQLENLDIQATMTLDRRLETSRQEMFVSVFDRVVKNLRTKRDISGEQSKLFITKLHDRLNEISAKNRREYDKRTKDLQKTMQLKGEMEIKRLDERKLKEIEAAKEKLDGADKKKTKEVLSMITGYYQSLEHDVQVLIQLEHDVEQEKIRKELSVNNRISSKELQSNLVKEIVTEAKLNEDDAQILVTEHLHAMAVVEKVHDDEKSRQVMALEMRLTERKALAQEMREQQQQEAQVLSSMKQNYENVLEKLVNSSQISDDEAAAYRDKLLKDVENLDQKLERQRSRQERNLHDRLTILKKRKLQEKEKEHQMELKNLEDSHENTENPKDVMLARQDLTQRHNEEMQDLERDIDNSAAQDLKELRAMLAKEARREYKAKVEKYYKELIKNGVLEDDLARLLDAHDQDVARLLEVQQAQQSKQKRDLEEKLMKRRELLTEKMKAEQKEQENIRNEEQKVLKNMIDNQVVISEEEKEKILREHEKNMAELESSLTLNKLRQKQMLEQKLEKRRAMKLDKLQQKHENENKRIKIENVDGATEEVDLLKKQEMEKIKLMRSDSGLENEIELIRDEMLKARMEALEEHNDRLGALIAELQIQKANQIAEINKQQRALGQLQAGILDDLDEKGVVIDPETKEILQRHQDQTQQLEKALQIQRDQQEQALKERLREKLKQKEQTLMQEQKDEIAKYLEGQDANSGLTRFRKAALKARHKSQLEQARQQIEKEIEQAVNEMKLQFEVNRRKAIEKQGIQFIAALVKCGRIQEEELDSVLQVLFPTKKPEEIDELLTQIYGPMHTRSSSITLNSSKPSSLEMKVIAQISPNPAARRKPRPRFEKPVHLDELPPPEAAANLPPVILQGSKGFNLQSTLQNQDRAENSTVPLGRLRLAPIDK